MDFDSHNTPFYAVLDSVYVGCNVLIMDSLTAVAVRSSGSSKGGSFKTQNRRFYGVVMTIYY